MDNTNGIPFIWDQEEENQLLGQLNPFLETTNFNENSISSSKAFDEITFEKKIGAENKCLPCENSFYQGAMNFKLLISDLREKSRFDNDFFYYQKYTNNLPKVLIANPSMYTMGVTYSEIEDSIPFEYVNPKTKKRIETKFKVGLNTRACLVNFKIFGSRISIDEKNKNINLYIEYIYSDSKDKKIDNTATAVKNDYFIDDKYVAIKLETDNFNDFFALCKEIEIYNTIKIKDLFVSKINATTIPSELDFLYENCPDEVIEIIKRNQEIKEDKIWNDILLLTKLDTEKFFTDTSSAFMNALKLIGYSFNIYDKFFSNQALVKTIYENLDGSSVVNGQKISNKSVFASFITALCIDNSFKGLRVLDKKFTIGKDYAISSGNIFQEEKDDELFLKQMKRVTKTETINQIDGPFVITTTSLEDVEKGNVYRPMDIVRLNYADIKDVPFPFVSAMTIKNFAEERDQQLRADAIRIGFDVLAIVLAVAFFPAGGAVGIIAESVGIGLALADIGITANREEILQDQGGKEFLEAWDKVYFVGGLILAPAIIVEQVFAKSMFCYFNALKNKSSLLQMYEKSLGEIILEREILTFAGNTLKTNYETTLKILAYNSDKIPKATAFVFGKYDSKMLSLYEKGAVFVEIGEKEYALVYKGEKLVQGTSNDQKLLEFYRKLKKVSRKSINIEEILEDLYKQIPKLSEDRKFWTCFNEAGTELRWANETHQEMLIKIEKQITDGKQAEKLMKERGVVFAEMNQKQQQLLTAGLEAEVVKEFSKYDKLLSVTNPVYKGKIKAGEFDGLFNKYLVEVKYNVSGTTKSGEFLDQFKKYIDPFDQNFINVQKKPVVLFIKQFSKGGSLDQNVLKTLEKSKEIKVIIITDFKQIKNLY